MPLDLFFASAKKKKTFLFPLLLLFVSDFFSVSFVFAQSQSQQYFDFCLKVYKGNARSKTAFEAHSLLVPWRLRCDFAWFSGLEKHLSRTSVWQFICFKPLDVYSFQTNVLLTPHPPTLFF